MGSTVDGMNITEYMKNDRQEYLLMCYKAVDNLSDERYEEMFFNLQSEAILINENYADAEWILKGNDGRKFHVRFDIEEDGLWNNRLKHFALLKLDIEKADIHSTSVNIKRIKMELSQTGYLDMDMLPSYRENIGKYSRRMYLAAFEEFLAFINRENTKEYLEAVNSVPQIHVVKPRNLPCCESILLFDHIISDFIQRTDIEEK